MSNTRYLQRVGQSWYVRVKVPRPLQGRVGASHIRRALGTRDLDEANRRKWPAVTLIQERLAALAGHSVVMTVDRVGAPLSASQEVAQPASPATLIELPKSLAVRIAPDRQTLDVLLDLWLAGADYLAQTKQQHGQAYRELRAFLAGDCLPDAVTAEVAVEYVEERIKRSEWSYATKRRKLNSLIAFWNWLGGRRSVERGFNPWLGFRLGKKNADKTKTRTKRPYAMEELLTLFSGAPAYGGLADVMALALLTGARMEEICALRLGNLRRDADGMFFVSIAKAKTQAGIRTLAVSHPIAIGVLTRRWNLAADRGTQLFPEFAGGGYDDKLSWAVSKAFGRYRDKQKLTRETDFHSFRRTFITLLENLSVDQVKIARYVGHELPTLAFTVYSGGSTEQTMRDTAAAIRYPNEVEACLQRFVERAAQSGEDLA